ncbi:hypothetical protein [Acinetobacter variabilis]|uniref:Uncharacterized protein n=1 Tax=Acinetobacter variabilis TaxID=70346 RepID=N8WWS6_9GAMM|nr:hypothetical protein [Acinetobacter variabilis]ENU99364.1 hypothetical protein F969_01683 [Acinetobacter variabilis]
MPNSLNISTKEFLKENFSSYQETKNLWVEAGGKASMISDTHDANTRWGDLFRKMEAGAITPVKLILVALQSYPLNKTLLIELKNQISGSELYKAKRFIELPNENSLIDLNHMSTEHASAAVSVALTESIEPNILDEKKEDTVTHAFKKSFASKAGELIAVAGSTSWGQLIQAGLSNL